MPAVTDLLNAEDVAAFLRQFLGRDELTAPPVLHVLSCWRGPDGVTRSLRIGPSAPTSAHDFFLLNLARARADAVLVSGKILRDEPHVRFDVQGPGKSAEGLRRYRSAVARRSDPTAPALVVLTSGRGWNPNHPALRTGQGVTVFTDDEGQRRLAAEHGSRAPPTAVVAQPSARAAIDWLHGKGLETVSVEAGPSTSQVLHDAPVVVDETLVGMYLGGTLPQDAVGVEVKGEAALRSVHGPPTACVEVPEPGGPWRFLRFSR